MLSLSATGQYMNALLTIPGSVVKTRSKKYDYYLGVLKHAAYKNNH